jgi:hypothetical protein
MLYSKMLCKSDDVNISLRKSNVVVLLRSFKYKQHSIIAELFKKTKFT